MGRAGGGGGSWRCAGWPSPACPHIKRLSGPPRPLALAAPPRRFFPAMVYLSSSKFSIAVLGNLGFALALSVYKVITLVRAH